MGMGMVGRCSWAPQMSRLQQARRNCTGGGGADEFGDGGAAAAGGGRRRSAAAEEPACTRWRPLLVRGGCGC